MNLILMMLFVTLVDHPNDYNLSLVDLFSQDLNYFLYEIDSKRLIVKAIVRLFGIV